LGVLIEKYDALAVALTSVFFSRATGFHDTHRAVEAVQLGEDRFETISTHSANRGSATWSKCQRRLNVDPLVWQIAEVKLTRLGGGVSVAG
jgi:hypothetical protein